jgi:hypothetical protein
MPLDPVIRRMIDNNAIWQYQLVNQVAKPVEKQTFFLNENVAATAFKEFSKDWQPNPWAMSEKRVPKPYPKNTFRVVVNVWGDYMTSIYIGKPSRSLFRQLMKPYRLCNMGVHVFDRTGRFCTYKIQVGYSTDPIRWDWSQESLNSYLFNAWADKYPDKNFTQVICGY